MSEFSDGLLGAATEIQFITPEIELALATRSSAPIYSRMLCTSAIPG